MSEMSEMLEHMEHAGHGGHGHDDHAAGPGKQIGITMALLGVMLALCAALVGSHRTELIKTTVEQSNKWGLYQSEAMKFRVMETDLELLKALTPSIEEEKQMDANLRAKHANAGKEDSEDTAEIKDLVASAVDDLADLLTPDQKEKVRFAKIAKRYEHDMVEAKEDAEAYEPAIEAHFEASEWYERAQLLAEVGIVVASIALLLSSRKVWMIAVLLGVGGFGIVTMTFIRTRGKLRDAEHKIEEAAKRTEAIEEDDEDEDEKKDMGGEGGEAKPGGKEEAKAAEGKPEEKKPEEKKPEDKKPAPSSSGK
jgi:hypothetical protein